MTTQISFLKENLTTSLTYGLIGGCAGALISSSFAVNPLIGAIYCATFATGRELTLDFCRDGLGRIGYNVNDHKYIDFCAEFISLVSMVVLVATTLKISIVAMLIINGAAFLNSTLLIAGMFKLLAWSSRSIITFCSNFSSSAN